MSGIFISYRRADAAGWAGRLGADLALAFGDVARFLDIDSIDPGADFVDAIRHAITDAQAVLVLIGPRWLDQQDAAGARRLDDPQDQVRLEIAHALAALATGLLVIPVLLGGAGMPEAARLPLALQGLARRNAFELSDLRWAHDLERLFRALEAGTALRRRAPAARSPDGASVSAKVSVGTNLELEDSDIGNVTGVRGAQPDARTEVDVLKGARIVRAKMGDLTGIDLGAEARTKRPPA